MAGINILFMIWATIMGLGIITLIVLAFYPFIIDTINFIFNFIDDKKD